MTALESVGHPVPLRRVLPTQHQPCITVQSLHEWKQPSLPCAMQWTLAALKVGWAAQLGSHGRRWWVAGTPVPLPHDTSKHANSHTQLHV